MEDYEKIKFFLGIECDEWEEFNDDTKAELSKGRGDVFVPPVEVVKKVFSHE